MQIILILVLFLLIILLNSISSFVFVNEANSYIVRKRKLVLTKSVD